jgi:endonuclease/exonuclease/phosphatase family metal-dependent hydrolase
MTKDISKTIATERKELMRLLNDSVPLRSVDENIIIATWNIKKFGKNKTDRAIQYIADIIERFDIIAIQEVMHDLDALKRLQSFLPGNYKFLVSEKSGNNERFAFLYDKRTVVNTGFVTNLTYPVAGKTHTGYQLHRIPYAASFKAGRFDFVIVNVHIYYGSGSAGKKAREEEIRNIVEYIHKMSNAEGSRVFDRDIFIVGDFNIAKYADKFFNALTSKKFKMPDGLAQTKTNLRQSATYDKIAWVPRKSFKFNGRFGVVPFNFAVYKGTPVRKLENLMSDHLPLWAEFQIKKLEQELDAALK